jgi:5'-nucleotidase
MMIDWQKVHTVLLDMDGTLLDLHFDNFFWQTYLPQRYAHIKAIPLEEAVIFIEHHYQLVAGTLKWYDIHYWTQLLDIDIMALKQEVSHLLAVRVNALTFLEKLVTFNYTILLVTNCHAPVLHFKLANIALGKYFHRIVSSHDYQAAKEELAFWQTLAKEHRLDKQNCLLIDDNFTVLQTAKKFGIGQVFAVATPDSKKPALSHPNFYCLDNFTDYLPP